MGLISAGVESVKSVFADQWREYFYCDSMEEDVLVVKGSKRIGGKSSNRKGSDNIITNGSIIAVNEGQCMLIVDQGKVAEICSVPGEFVYDTSTEPTIMYGKLGENIKKSFATMGKRFTFGGDTAKDQRVYFVNTKEILGNKYGGQIPFKLVDESSGLNLSLDLRCHGEYSYHITDPILFYANVCGNVTDEYTRDRIDSQLKSELLTALQPAFAKISAMHIGYDELSAHTLEIGQALNDILSEKWGNLRGIEVKSFGINGVSISDEDLKTIQEMQKVAVLQNTRMAAAKMTAATANAMEAAASNTSTGPMMAFAGMNMANMAGGNINAQQLFAMSAQEQQQADSQQQTLKAAASWTCSCGAEGNTGKFCSQCGAAKPAEPNGWTCSCGAVNKGKFCTECGQPKPAGALLYRCDKCGWEPEDPKNPPKFCPNCGDVFDDNDIKA